MSFEIFRKERHGTDSYYSKIGRIFHLAGNKNGLLFKLWNKKKPVGPGWSVTADELLNEFDSEYRIDDYALVTIFIPDSAVRIGLAEIEAIHLYTEEDTEENCWSVVMLELRQIYNDAFGSSKEEFLKTFKASKNDKVVEFLYLKGDGTWGWGRNGAFIYDDARKYFQNVFNK